MMETTNEGRSLKQKYLRVHCHLLAVLEQANHKREANNQIQIIECSVKQSALVKRFFVFVETHRPPFSPLILCVCVFEYNSMNMSFKCGLGSWRTSEILSRRE